MKKKIEKDNNKKISVFKIIFFISLLYYAFWFICAIYLSFKGVDHGWAMPAISNGKLMYGFDAFSSVIVIGVLYTITLFWFIPLYQLIYIIGCIIRKIKSKNDH